MCAPCKCIVEHVRLLLLYLPPGAEVARGSVLVSCTRAACGLRRSVTATGQRATATRALTIAQRCLLCQ